ncbi:MULTISPECIES: hypothetical protein [Haloferacaceae]|uniref:Uncharacterized protein n=1 Tax=Halorubrum glutamatedens TaxID=2707018 RepID=A0ABD5QR58_9EURY|nr:hypothetical protein [Halobellus captivus]
MNLIQLTELTANGDRIRLHRIETPKGERLEIETPTSSIRLDAVALEALTWQDNDALAALPDANTTQRSPTGTGELSERIRLTTISNEFGFIVVYEMHTEAGIRIDLEAEKQGESIRLCPAELETLAEQDHDLITEWVKTDLND